MEINICRTFSEAETVDLGRRIGALLKDGSVLALYGDLGAGKTHFVQGIANGMGIEECVVSPTFTILNYYEGTIPLQHFDFYRLETAEELENLGFYDYIQQGVTVIEWAEKFPEVLPSHTLNIRIEKESETQRRWEFQFPDQERWERIKEEVQKP